MQLLMTGVMLLTQLVVIMLYDGNHDGIIEGVPEPVMLTQDAEAVYAATDYPFSTFYVQDGLVYKASTELADGNPLFRWDCRTEFRIPDAEPEQWVEIVYCKWQYANWLPGIAR